MYHKYDTVINYIEENIRNGSLQLYSKIPSLKALQMKFKLSRCSVFQAMENLKQRGIIESEPSVGYFVVNTTIRTKKKVILIFAEIPTFKEDLYKAILTNLDKDTEADLAIHYREITRMQNLIESANGRYNSIVLMPGPAAGLDHTLSKIKGGCRVFLLDHFNRDLIGKYSSVGQDFVGDTYEALRELNPKIAKYKSIVLVQKSEVEPSDRFDGIRKYGQEFGVETRWINDPEGLKLLPGILYVVPSEKELVTVIKKSKEVSLKTGKDFGLISFNESPLKEVLEGGITVITTDFRKMGETIAQMVNESGQDKVIHTIHNPWRIILRDSI